MGATARMTSMSRLTSSWPSPGEPTPPFTATRLTAGPDVPASRSKVVDIVGVEGVERHDRDGLALAVEAERAESAELVDAVDDRRGHPAVGAGGDRAAQGGTFARPAVEPVDAHDEAGKGGGHPWLARRRLEGPAGRVREVTQRDVEQPLDDARPARRR